MKQIYLTKKILAILIIFFWSNSVSVIFAQDAPLIFENISNKEGLNQNSIFSINQDRTGFIWMGTSNGLIKHDGISFLSHIPHPGDSTTLINNMVMEVYEDSNENLWLGTYNGLCLYQANTDEFVWINSFNKLINKNVIFYKILEDAKHDLWLATSEGLFVLKQTNATNNRFVVRKITQANTGQQLFPENTRIKEIYVLPDSSMLIGSSKGLYHIKGNETDGISLLQSFNKLNEKPLTVNTIYQQADGLIWLGCTDGVRFLKLYDKDHSYRYRWDEKPLHFSDQLELKDIDVRCLFYDDADHILIGTFQEGLFTYSKRDGYVEHYKPQTDNPKSIGSNVINDIIMDKSGVIWLATAHGGVSKIDRNRKPFFNLSSQHFNSSSLSSNLISGILLDSKKRLWVGTYQKGLNVSKKAFSFGNIYQTTFDHYLEDQLINCIYETNEKLILIGTTNGLNIYNLDQEAFVMLPFDHPIHIFYGSKEISAILQVDNEIWIGSDSGLSKITLATSSFDLISGDFVHEIYDGKENSPVQYPSGIINVMMNDPGIGLWIGTRNGLYLLKDNKGIQDFEVFNHDPTNNQSISSNNVFSLHKDTHSNSVWVGTFGGGLSKVLLDDANKILGFERITKRDGLPDNAIYSILEDTNRFLWISTDEGIVKLNPETLEAKSFNMDDGLPANNFRKNSHMVLDDGIMFMGGLMGLTIFDPLNITENTYAPMPVITGLKLFNQSVQPNRKFQGKDVLSKPIHKTSELKLPYDFNQITFEFAAMHYAAPKKNTFEYMLEGADNNWISVDHNQRFANYSQLRPGNYLFKLKSYNGDGLESDVPQSLSVTISKPYYLTNYAFLVYLILLFAVGYLIFRYLKYMLQLRRRIASDEMEKNHIKEISEAKLQFFTDISHELKTPLTLIISPLEKILYNQKLHPDLKKIVSNVNTNGRRLLNLTNTLIDFRKLGQGRVKLSVSQNDLGEFVKKTTNAFFDYSVDKKINLTVNVPDKRIFGWFDPAIVERVLFNLLSNAFKYTLEGGQIDVRFKLTSADSAIVEVSDTGKGMTPKVVNHIFERFFQEKNSKNILGSSGIGLSLVKKLIELHKGEIEVFSTLGKGSIFKLTIPIDRGNYHNEELAGMVNNQPNKAYSKNEISDQDSLLSIQSVVDKPTLLVVEDNLEIQDFITSIFEKDYTVLNASDGEAGFNLAVENIPDLIISDVMMPGMGGFELTAKLKKDRHTCHIPLILLTALNDFESRKTAFEEGGDIYISKPFSPHLLELQVKNLIKTRQKEAEFIKMNLLMEPEIIEVESRDKTFLQSIKKLIEENYQSPDLNVHTLAQKSHMSYLQFYRKFNALVGINTNEYIRTFRLKKAASMLKNDPKIMINQVMFCVGFSSQSYFTKSFKKYYGCTPAQYKRRDNPKKLHTTE
ncbi:MAG: signal transduction histidine kinase/ligand-binding sensor domain-containing protein/AraC-like DNA-binding protein [Saprospiraceae bacterium]|jgi:signal transduction histidine kinase/ligand-binding sensor domain-containing protein/AraC-like DNA-binding protein/AmiR/NasT family two-component response regulator